MKVAMVLTGPEQSEHYRMAALLWHSIQTAMPSVSVVQLTDETSPSLPGVAEVRRRSAAPNPVLRLAHYADLEPGDWLLLDADTVVQRDVRDVFDAPFDLAVADRVGTFAAGEAGSLFMQVMPHNAGVLFSRSPMFWQRARAALDQLTPGIREALVADQLVINTTLRQAPFTVRVLPGLIYNYPPHAVDDPQAADAAILHFKGKRKVWHQARLATFGAIA